MNMLCSRCKKRVAVIFITKMDGSNNPVNEGLCLRCAKELGIKPVCDMMDKMGITDEDAENMSDMLTLSPEDGDFEAGGAPTFPFLNQLFGGKPADSDSQPKSAPKKTAERMKSDPRPKRKFLDNYCDNLSQKARTGQLDRIIGRDEEIYRVIQILNRRIKNNPCLIGEPGVGKTAVAEGIALRIAEGKVPAKLLDKEIMLLDLTALVAGTQFRGQFESRVKGLIEEVKADKNVILFIDEVHNLVGTGDSEGSMNAANILKPALSRGEIQVIGATTFNEYRKYIEKDSALERRFQPVTINEPSIADAIEVLRGVKNYYEQYHHVSVSDAIVDDIVRLSERYINDRYLPDKAIDLLDEACSCAELRNKALEDYLSTQKNLDKLRADEQAASSDTENTDYEKIAQLKAEMIRCENQLAALEPEAKGAAVTDEDVARVIELWTGIPASKIQQNELRRVADLEQHLREKIIGQDEAVRLVAQAVKRSRVRIGGVNRPASFIFVGPTGVGKTELVKVLSRELFDDVDPLIRLDMSEFMEKHSVSRIVGSPPGYVGYDEAGQLTEKVRRRPYSVVLFDEIEKAHPDVMNILLQILDEGKITDAHGRTVSFANTVIIMTSNAGSQLRESALGFERSLGEATRERVMKALREFLRPEFLGRVDEIVVFRDLDKKDFAGIARLLMNELREALAHKHISLEFDDSVLELIADMSFGKASGARDIRRVIREKVEDEICNLLIESENYPDSVSVCAENGEISVRGLSFAKEPAAVAQICE